MRKFAVIGLGQFGTIVAQSLIERGDILLVVGEEKDIERLLKE